MKKRTGNLILFVVIVFIFCFECFEKCGHGDFVFVDGYESSERWEHRWIVGPLGK